MDYSGLNIIKSTSMAENSLLMTRYLVRNGKIPVGYVNLLDKPDGVFVSFIRNYNPEQFKGFGKIADQLEVEHCLKRGLSNFSIESEAALNSHAYHYKRGKRFGKISDLNLIKKLVELFGTSDINKIVADIIRKAPSGKNFYTAFLGNVPMYMPQNLIKKYIERVKNCPLLK